MRKLAYIVFMAMMIALLASGCFKMAPTAQLETEEAIFILKNGSIEVKAARELSGLEVFLKAKVEESEVSSKGICSIVKHLDDGTYIATAIGGKFKSGETVMTIRGGFTDLKKLSIETMGVELEEEYGPQSQVPENGVYVQDTWVSSNASGNKLVIGAKNLNIGDYSDTPINGFSFVVKYDPADIEITNVGNSVPGSRIETFEIDNSTGELNVYVGYPDESGVFIVAPTELLEITFSSKGVKTVSEVTLENVQVTVFDSNSEWNPVDISAVGTGGFITIGNPKLLGDFNLDGIVGTADLADFATYYRETYSGEADPLAYYDIGPAKKAYGGAWEDIYTEAKPDHNVDLLDLVIMAQNWAVPKPTDFNYVKTLDELNAAIASDSFTSIVFGSDISGTPNVVGRLVDINLNGYTLTGNLSFDTGDSGTINLYAGTIDGDLTVDAPNATFNNYADVTGEVTINGVSAGTWNEYFCENNLVWNAENSTLYVYCGAEGITFNASASRVVFDGPAIVTGGHFIEYAIIAPGTNVTFDTPPQHVEILDGTIWNSRTGSFYSTIQAAITEADAGDTIFVAAGEYVETGQIVIDKNLTIVGADKETTIIKPEQNTGSSGDARGWFLVSTGCEFNLSNVTLDGEGWEVHQVIRSFGSGTIDTCSLKNIGYEEYYGLGIVIMGDYNMTVSNNEFSNIGRIGIQAFGPGVTDAKILGNTYTGKGEGDWLDYAIEISAGANATVDGNTIRNCGPATDYAGNWSGAGIYVEEAFAEEEDIGTTFATVTNNVIENCQIGLAIGTGIETYVEEPSVFTSGNTFSENSWHVTNDSLNQDVSLQDILANNTFSTESLIVENSIRSKEMVDVINTSKNVGYYSIQAAIDDAEGGDVIEVAEGTHTIDSSININKAITLRGVGTNGEWKTKLLVSDGGGRLNIHAASIIENLEIEKTDDGNVDIIYIGSDNVTIRYNKIHGQYTMGDPETSRGMEIAASTGLLIEHNTIYNLRQPAYINAVTGTIQNNDVFGTRGWVVVSESNITFEDNTWGDGSVPNYYDIAIILNNPAGANNYENFVQISKNNNYAVVENQFYSPALLSVVFVDENTVSTGNNGSFYDPYKTIGEAIARVAPGGTIRVAEGEYGEVFSVSKSLTIMGAGSEATIINGDPNNHSITLSNASGVTIKDMGFDFGLPAIGLTGKVAIQMVGTNSNINIENCHFKDGYYVTIQGNANDLTVKDCNITNVKSGINLQYGSNLVVQNTDISVVAQGDTNDTYCVRFGSETGTANGMSITGCEFDVDKNENHSAIIVRAAATGTLAANESKILGEVVNLSLTSLNATCNWWGSIDPAVIAGKVSGLVNWSPFWTTAVGSCDGYAPVRNTTIDLPYATIQEAFDDLYALDKPAEPTTYTIEVKKGTYDEQLLIKQQENKNIELRAVDGDEGDEVVLRRTVIINGQGRHNGEESLTISGFDFTYEGFEGLGGGKDFIVTTDPSGATNGYAHNVTIDNCSFSGNPADLSFVAIRNPKAGYDFIISDCQGDHLHSLAQFASAVTGAKIENCTLVDCKSGLNLNASTNVEVDGLWFEGPGYGIRAGQSTGTPADTTLKISNSVLLGTSDCTATDLGDPDTALVLRGDAPKNVTISESVIMNTNPGSYAIANLNSANASSYFLTISGNYWGEAYSTDLLGGLGDAGVTCASYYQDAAYTTAPPTLSNLVNIP